MTVLPAPVSVVMVGGGYANLHAYRALIGRIRADRPQICVVTADDCHNFHGFSGEVVAGLLPLDVTRTALADLMPHAEVLHGNAIRIEVEKRTVLAGPPAAERTERSRTTTSSSVQAVGSRSRRLRGWSNTASASGHRASSASGSSGSMPSSRRRAAPRRRWGCRR